MRDQPPPINRARARLMRRDPTRAEELLWQQLRNRSLMGCKFRRQAPLAHYILDFVCFEHRLIVEVDGWQHVESGSDAVRDAFFQAQGFRILRFWNEEVEDNLDGVVLRVLGELRNRGE